MGKERKETKRKKQRKVNKKREKFSFLELLHENQKIWNYFVKESDRSENFPTLSTSYRFYHRSLNVLLC